MWDEQRREGSRRHSTDLAAVARSKACAIQRPSGGQRLSVNTMGKPREKCAQDHLRKLNQNLRGGSLKSC